MPILCPYCPLHDEIAISHYEAHIIASHPERIEDRALMAIQTTNAQVAYIYAHHPEAKQDNGILISYILKAYPKLHRNENADTITISAEFADFAYFLKHTNSITRLGRYIRHPSTANTEAITQRYADPLPLPIKEAVKQVMKVDPSTRYNEGFLCQAVLRHYPMPNTQITYAGGIITLICSRDLLPSLLRRLETITRRSRELRAEMGYANSVVAERRQIEYSFSTGYWRQDGMEARV